ncbi:MAG: PHB depolymerase family esterase [Actinomycetota bacterium]|nr:PHB depolymerase family esterase [Actinomycetota bacterium]
MRGTVAVLVLFLLALVAAACGGEGDLSAGGSFSRGSFANEHGEREYWLYVPDGRDAGSTPLVVMLHGCGQDAEEFATSTRMNALAEREKFLVLYPEQDPGANRSGCWNWFEPSDQERGMGEPSIIAGATEKVIDEQGVDPRHVYVAGMSAGGAMSTVLAATYPELYAAVGVHSGLEYAAADGAMAAVAAQKFGGPDPDRQGRLAFESARPAEARVTPAIVFHGEEDVVVDVVNAHQSLSQWAQTNDYADNGADDDVVTDEPDDALPGRVPEGYDYVRYVYEGPEGGVIMEKWIVEDLGHAWSGGDPEGSFTDPEGPNASEEMLRFFRQHGGG